MSCISFRRVMMPAIAAAIVMTSVCTASAQEAERGQPGFLDQLFGGSDRFGNSERAPPAAAQERVAQGGADLVVRLERMENQIRQLTGVIEQLQVRNQQLEGQMRRLSDDTEFRFQELRGGVPPRQPAPPRPTATPAPGQGAPTPPAAAASGRRGDAFDPTLNPNAPGAPRPMGTTAPSAPLARVPDHADVEPLVAPPDLGRPSGAPLDLATPREHAAMGEPLPPPAAPPRNPGATGAQLAAVPPGDNSKSNFDVAYGYLLRKDYALADESFRGFLRRFPNDRLVPDAQYWLGESLYQRQRYRDAAESFLDVSTKHESTSKAPDALLRLGQALAALGEKEAACASFAEVGRKYPRAAVGVKQGVDREQKRVRC
jgi:tol-pal system protein YbgF